MIMRRILLVLPFFISACEPAPKTPALKEPPVVELPASVKSLTPGDAERFLAAHPELRLAGVRALAALQVEIDVAVEDHVHPISQPVGANVFVPQVGVGHTPLIEGVANPADRIGVGRPSARVVERGSWLVPCTM